MHYYLQVFSEPITTSSTMKWWRATTNQQRDWPSLWTPGKSLAIQNARSLQRNPKSPNVRSRATSSAVDHSSRTQILHSVTCRQSWIQSHSSRPVNLTTRTATLARLKTWSTATQPLLTSNSLDCEEYGPSICLSVVSKYNLVIFSRSSSGETKWIGENRCDDSF